MARVSDTHTDHLSVQFCRISLKHQSRDFSEKSEFFFNKSTFWKNFYLTFIENKSLIPKVSCVLLESLNIDLKTSSFYFPTMEIRLPCAS